ncbi:MAG: pyridoxal phosphate-dependent aminotransferase [Rhodospirillaceae bacterium]|nr:pyridoxal phosphate-dependent aminotransferase [Rhodospirillaceae bacterium]MBT5665073.1 pyridoxal phosphate-dependent aminotransferase [Rhodospirillaceae bacterium]MBT5809888.1 pyridoxal phosphate-dependent aminotransferase [Rhodospirillaceae bacterium]
MPFIAPRMDRIETTASSAMTQRARELVASGMNVIALTQGQPDFETPEHVKEAAIAAMSAGDTRYTLVSGTPAMKEAIAAKFQRENGLDYGLDQVIAGTGGKQIIYDAMMATIQPGDEVIIPAPYWMTYADIVGLFDGIPVIVRCARENGYKPTPEQLEAAITPNTKWIILNSPNNPSGATISRPEMKALTDVLMRHSHVYVLADDMYEHIVFDDLEFVTPAQVEPGLYSRTLTLNGVSKAYSMTGWRLGYAGGPATLISAMAKAQLQSTGNPSSISQAAAVAALNGPQDIVVERTREFQERRDLIVGLLNQANGLQCHRPEGAFYAYPDCSALMGAKTREGDVIESDADLAMYFLESHGVGLVHGAAYDVSPHIRVSFATSTENLIEAGTRIQRACAALS